MRFRVGQIAVACCLSAVGLTVGVGLVLADPQSRASRWVSDHVLPYGVTR